MHGGRTLRQVKRGASGSAVSWPRSGESTAQPSAVRLLVEVLGIFCAVYFGG